MTTSSTNYLGRNGNSDRIFATMTLRATKSVVPGTGHRLIRAGAPVISIVGHSVAKGGRSVTGVGQLNASMGRINTSDAYMTDRDVMSLRTIWRDWHLNDMRAECDHMKIPANSTDRERLGITCPVSGYQYGHAWLYRPIPAHVLAEYTRLMRIPSGLLVPSYVY